MKKIIKSDEIDLIEVVINIWDNKLKIVAITLIFIILSMALTFIIKPTLKAKTEILPITIFENNLYAQFNSLNTDIKGYRLIEINSGYLLSLFLEELQTKDIIIKAIKKYQLIDQKKFNSEDGYLKAVKKKALKLDLIRPKNVDGSKRGEIRLNWIIEFEVDDEEKWEKALSFIEIEINKNIRSYLKFNFDIILDNLKMLDQFKIEDLNLKISNVKKDYNIETTNRIAFLKEQAFIARELNIENNTLEIKTFSTPSKVISNLQSEKSYYMRGYLMIEKEIELIETRTDNDAFNKNLLALEKQKRTLLDNKVLKRIERLFNNTPIINENEFNAGKIIYQNTEYEASYNLKKVVLFSGLFGAIFGMFYVLILSAIRQRK